MSRDAELLKPLFPQKARTSVFSAQIQTHTNFTLTPEGRTGVNIKQFVRTGPL